MGCEHLEKTYNYIGNQRTANIFSYTILKNASVFTHILPRAPAWWFGFNQSELYQGQPRSLFFFQKEYTIIANIT